MACSGPQLRKSDNVIERTQKKSDADDDTARTQSPWTLARGGKAIIKLERAPSAINHSLCGSRKRMQQHFNFFVTYLRQVSCMNFFPVVSIGKFLDVFFFLFLLSFHSYEHATGREAVLEMIRVIIQKFPQRFLDEQSEILFMELVRPLANDPRKGVPSLIATAIKLLIRHISPHSVDVLLKCSLAWYLGKDQLLWSTAAQVLGLFVEVMQKKFRECISTVLLMEQDANNILVAC
ncbi:Small subunit processome component 20-like protein [Drosera capensis]